MGTVPPGPEPPSSLEDHIGWDSSTGGGSQGGLGPGTWLLIILGAVAGLLLLFQLV